MFSEFGDVRIVGEDAKPELSNFSWFTIALRTTMAAGVLFWGPGEPIAHYAYPPTELYGVEPSTSGSLKFAMETMFLHWTIVPYCMYTVPAVVFAFMYYNAKKPYSIASEVSPLLGDRCYHPRWMQTIDAITLFAIGAGMAGSVAQAFMNISGGISKIFGLPSNARLWFMVGIVVAAVTVATAVSGIQKAMKHVSNINVYGFAIFLIFLLVFSNASFLFNLSTEALGGFAGTFIERILIIGESVGTQWPQWWTTFYWFSWMAWAPTSGAFMGQIAYGRCGKTFSSLYVGLCASQFIWMDFSQPVLPCSTDLGLFDLDASANTAVLKIFPCNLLSALPPGNLIIVHSWFPVFSASSASLQLSAVVSTGHQPRLPGLPDVVKACMVCRSDGSRLYHDRNRWCQWCQDHRKLRRNVRRPHHDRRNRQSGNSD